MRYPILSKFGSLRPKGSGGWLGRCPAHDDRSPSLSIDVGSDKLLLHCKAGCSIDAICAAVGITTPDLRLGDAMSQSHPVPASVSALARAKGLPESILRRYGVKDVAELTPAERFTHDPKGLIREGEAAVWIPYYTLDGSIAGRTRLRTAIAAKDGSRWLGTFGPIQPYGLQDLADAREAGSVCLCEGETDYWTLRQCEIPALGIPGATSVRVLQREHLAGITTVYVCQDNDPAGATFVSSIRAHVRDWGVTVHAIASPVGKDINDLYRADPAGASDRILARMREASAVPAVAERTFTAIGAGFRLTVPDAGLTLELDRVRRTNWGDLTGELAVVSDTAGDVVRSSVNLSQMDKRQTMARQLASRAGMAGVDWSALFEDFALRCLRADRDGGEWVDLRDVPIPPPDATWDLDGFHLSQADATCLFADGGTGKSLIALYLAGCLARQGVTVLYLDGEWHAGEHKARLVSLFGETPPSLWYESFRRPLELGIEPLQRKIADRGVGYVILDSVGLLTVGAPETSEAALGYSRAVQQLHVGSLSLAHITKAQDLQPMQQKPFGSVFYHNLFRRIYYAKREEEDAGPGIKRLVIWNTKSNHRGPGQGPFGIEVEDREDRSSVRRIDAVTVSGLADKLPLWRRLEEALRVQPQSASDLAETLDVSLAAVRKALTRGAGTKFQLLSSIGTPIWALRQSNQHVA